MAVQFINVESFFFLRKFVGPKNPLMSASIAYFVFLRLSAKNTAAEYKGRAKVKKFYLCTANQLGKAVTS